MNDLKVTMTEVTTLQDLLVYYHGNQKRVAEAVSISRQTVSKVLKAKSAHLVMMVDGKYLFLN